MTASAPQSNTEASYEDAEVITASSNEEEDDLILTNPRLKTAITLILEPFQSLSIDRMEFLLPPWPLIQHAQWTSNEIEKTFNMPFAG